MNMTDRQAEIDKLKKEKIELEEDIELYKIQEKYLLVRLEYAEESRKSGRSGR